MNKNNDNQKPEAPVSRSDGRRFAAINLIYGTPMFTGTEQACWQYVHEKFGTNMAALLVDVREYFEALRNDPAHHLGMGDVRLTMAMQDEVTEMAASQLGKLAAGVLPVRSSDFTDAAMKTPRKTRAGRGRRSVQRVVGPPVAEQEDCAECPACDVPVWAALTDDGEWVGLCLKCMMRRPNVRMSDGGCET